MPKRMKLIDDEMDAWVDGLLASDDARPSAPAKLHVEVRHRRRRKRWLIACGFAATAAAATLAAVLLWPQSNPTDGERQIATAKNPPPRSAGEGLGEGQPPQNPVATFVARGDLIAVPIESDDPTVTIVQIYPTTLAQRRWRRRAAIEAILSNTQLKPTTPVRGG